ncbi:MAG: hypothetical protein Q8K70_12120 [Bacteroidota bacterium]|nr:hypothetical protein [Bacteroidota bacterium]
MNTSRKTILNVILLFISNILSGQDNTDKQTIDFFPSFKKNEVLAYQFVETRFRQNLNGHYSFLMYDTTYMLFKVKDINDSNTVLEFKYADYYKNGQGLYDEINQHDLFKTQPYLISLDPKGEFIELINWEFFAALMIDNLKVDYAQKKIDSNTLKYFYIQYHNQEIVEKAVIPKVIEMLAFFGKTYTEGVSYNVAKEVVNPFGGSPIEKSCSFVLNKLPGFKNSMVFKGKVFTNTDDNDKLQEDFYHYINDKNKSTMIDANTVGPEIYIMDTYEMQWGIINKRLMTYTTSHTVFINKEKQGLDIHIRLIVF